MPGIKEMLGFGEPENDTLDSKDKYRAVIKPHATEVWVNPTIRDMKDNPLHINQQLLDAVKLLGSKQQVLRFSPDAPEVNMNTYNNTADAMKSGPKDTVASSVLGRKFINFYRPTTQIAPTTDGLAKILAHELTHNAGNLSNRDHKENSYFSPYLNPDTLNSNQDWPRIAEELRAIMYPTIKEHGYVKQ
jgi:hypothetical protein